MVYIHITNLDWLYTDWSACHIFPLNSVKGFAIFVVCLWLELISILLFVVDTADIYKYTYLIVLFCTEI